MTQFDVFWWFLGNMDYLVWQGLHNSFSRENIVYFWSSIFESFFLGFLGNSFYCSYDGITGHFLDPKWWIVLSCICLFKKCMSKTSMHPCRKWIVQSNKTSNFTCFFHFLGFWLGQNFSGKKMRVTWVHPEMSIGINMWSAQIIRWNSSSSWTWQNYRPCSILINQSWKILGDKKNHSLCWRGIAGWIFGLNFWH